MNTFGKICISESFYLPQPSTKTDCNDHKGEKIINRNKDIDRTTGSASDKRIKIFIENVKWFRDSKNEKV